MNMPFLNLSDYIGTFFASPLAKFVNHNPWDITTNASMIVHELIGMLANPDEYKIEDNIAVHKSAEIETGATLKGPLIIGPGCFGTHKNLFNPEGEEVILLDLNIK